MNYDNKTASIIQDSITASCNVPIKVEAFGSDQLTLSLFGEEIGTYSDVDHLIHDAVILSKGYSVGMEKASEKQNIPWPGDKEPKDEKLQETIDDLKQKRQKCLDAAKLSTSMGDTDMAMQKLKEADEYTAKILRLEKEEEHPKEQPAAEEEKEEVYYAMDFPFGDR
jgi:hypothetical protein